jgi:hypothetical protein
MRKDNSMENSSLESSGASTVPRNPQTPETQSTSKYKTEDWQKVSGWASATPNFSKAKDWGNSFLGSFSSGAPNFPDQSRGSWNQRNQEKMEARALCQRGTSVQSWALEQRVSFQIPRAKKSKQRNKETAKDCTFYHQILRFVQRKLREEGGT